MMWKESLQVARNQPGGTDVKRVTGSVRSSGKDFEPRAQVEGTLTGEVG